ncbi:MAG: hypothetical protein JNK05_38255 [Myxococcales bacterium]|nr:hypothetical protein [Myxococcales bacterium]
MADHRRMLVVLPSTGISLADGDIDELVKRTLDVGERTAGDAARAVVDLTLAGKIRALGERALAKSFDSLSTHDKESMIASARVVVHALVRRMLASAQVRDAALPYLRCYEERDAALESLRSSDGPFAVGVVYAAHPYVPDFYISLARFHSHLLDEKRAEFVRLAAALGARSIRLAQSEDETRSAGARAGLAGTNVADVGLGGARHSKSASSFDLSATFEPPAARPTLPNKLRWIHHEPLWQAMAEARLAHGATSFAVSFSYDQDFGVDAAAQLAIEGIGLKAGGKVTHTKSVSQTYEIEFWPQQRER